MATRRTASKTSARAGVNINIDTRSTNKAVKQINRDIKNVGSKVLVWVLVQILLGAMIGVGVCWYFTRNDTFEIIGEEEITLTLGENYTDQGVKVISFGRNVEDKVIVKTNLKPTNSGVYTSNEVGTFYILYKVDCIKYGSIFKVQKIRLITFVEPSEEEEIIPDEGGSRLAYHNEIGGLNG